MKKLTALLLILALAMPAAALAEDLYIVKHYTLHINAVLANASTGKSDTRLFDYDSFTADIYLTSDPGHGYYFETKCVAGIFVNSGMIPVRFVDIGNGMRMADGGGNSWPFKYDEEADEVWIDYGRGYFRFQPVDVFSIYEDWN